MDKNALTYRLAEPLNGATAARVDIDAGSGNLRIDRLTDADHLLATGTLEYFANQGVPTRTLASSDGLATLTLAGHGIGKPRFHFPWEACNGGTEWQIHLNPTISSDLNAHSEGGNIQLDLAGMAVTCVLADTGGGNLDVVLPDNAANLNVAAKTGAGNVTVEIGYGIAGSSVVTANSGAGNVVVCLPSGVAARIHATVGLGKATVDPQFGQTGKDTYQTSDFDSAIDKVDLTVHSGAGNVIVNTR